MYIIIVSCSSISFRVTRGKKVWARVNCTHSRNGCSFRFNQIGTRSSTSRCEFGQSHM